LYVQAYLLVECNDSKACHCQHKFFAEGGPYGCNNAHHLVINGPAAGIYITVVLNVTTGSRVAIGQPVSFIFKIFTFEGCLLFG
jgi:hypothetical protein